MIMFYLCLLVAIIEFKTTGASDGNFVYAAEGLAAEIPCLTFHAKDTPNSVKKWILPKSVKDADVTQTRHGNTVILNKPHIKQSGLFLCRVDNGREYKHHLVIYQLPSLKFLAHISYKVQRSCDMSKYKIQQVRSAFCLQRNASCEYSASGLCLYEKHNGDTGVLSINMTYTVSSTHIRALTKKACSAKCLVEDVVGNVRSKYKKYVDRLWEEDRANLEKRSHPFNNFYRLNVDYSHFLQSSWCQIGFESDGFMCIPCEPGSYYGILKTCEDCPIGKYNPFYARTKCLHCPKGRTTIDVAATDQAECIQTRRSAAVVAEDPRAKEKEAVLRCLKFIVPILIFVKILIIIIIVICVWRRRRAKAKECGCPRGSKPLLAPTGAKYLNIPRGETKTEPIYEEIYESIETVGIHAPRPLRSLVPPPLPPRNDSGSGYYGFEPRCPSPIPPRSQFENYDDYLEVSLNHRVQRAEPDMYSTIDGGQSEAEYTNISGQPRPVPVPLGQRMQAIKQDKCVKTKKKVKSLFSSKKSCPPCPAACPPKYENNSPIYSHPICENVSCTQRQAKSACVCQDNVSTKMQCGNQQQMSPPFDYEMYCNVNHSARSASPSSDEGQSSPTWHVMTSPYSDQTSEQIYSTKSAFKPYQNLSTILEKSQQEDQSTSDCITPQGSAQNKPPVHAITYKLATGMRRVSLFKEDKKNDSPQAEPKPSEQSTPKTPDLKTPSGSKKVATFFKAKSMQENTKIN